MAETAESPEVVRDRLAAPVLTKVENDLAGIEDVEDLEIVVGHVRAMLRYLLEEERDRNNLFDSELNATTWMKRAASNDHRISDQFSRQLRLAPREYLEQRRMEVSLRMIEESGVPVADVATSIGYGHGVFERVFRDNFGLRPDAYRQQDYQQSADIHPNIPLESRPELDQFSNIARDRITADRVISSPSIEEVLLYIETHLFELDHNFGDVAADFKNELGVTPHVYIGDRHMEVAGQMLSAGNLEVAAIATHLGYERRVFERRFKKTFGAPPEKYRKQQKTLYICARPAWELITDDTALVRKSKMYEPVRKYLLKILEYLSPEPPPSHLFDHGLGVENLIKIFEISRRARQQFTTHIGCSLQDYIELLRILTAIELLNESNLSTEGIAKTIGYSSWIKAFRSAFQRVTGCTIGFYRDQDYREKQFPNGELREAFLEHSRPTLRSIEEKSDADLNPYVSKTLEYIRNHLLELDRHFGDIAIDFNNEVGASPHRYIRDCHMEIAALVMCNSDFVIHEIGTFLGYETYNTN